MHRPRASRRAARLLLMALFALATLPVAAASRPAEDVRISPDRIEVSLAFEAARVVPSGEQTEPAVGDLPRLALAPGHPRLPVASYTVLLPEGTRVARVTLRGAAEAPAGTHDLAWGQPPRRISTDDDALVGRDGAVFASSDWYPAQPVQVTGEGAQRGYRLASLRVWPVQVRPASGEVRSWRSVEIVLELDPALTQEDRTSGAATALTPRGIARDVASLAGTVLNPETAFGYEGSRGSEATRDADQPYLIVTTESLRPAFVPLIEHRAAHGLPGEIRTIESIDSVYQGRDLAEKLRNAIAEAWSERGTSFVLLGGDDVDDDGNPLIPVRHCKPYDNTPSDYYYGALDGDWDTDGDGTFCEADEVDYYTEVHIGRATVNTVDEAERWVGKLLQVEAGLPEERRTDLVFMGEKLDDQTWGDDAMEETAELIDEGEYAIDRLYARPGMFHKANVIASLDRGPQLVNHLGHAGSDYVMGLGIADVQALVNESPFFAYSQGCYAGSFDQGVSGNREAISEHFLTSERAAHGVVMNGRYGWYCVGWPHCLSQRLAHEFYDALFTEGFGTLGEANDDSRADYAPDAQGDHTARYCFLETNLHGDPAARVFLRGTQLRHAGHRVIEDDPVYGNANGVADPGETVRLAVTLENVGTETATGVGARLVSSDAAVTVHDHWATWPDIPPGESAEQVSAPYRVTFSGSCGSAAPLRLEVRHGGLADVSVFSQTLGERDEWSLMSDDFETNQGWTVGGNAAAGTFVRANPHGVVDETVGTVQPEDDATPGSGETCWVTGNPVPGSGFDPHDGDVDRGTTWIESPAFSGLGEGRLRLRFDRWFHRTGVEWLNEGYFRALVSNDGGATWAAELERLDGTAPRWTTREIQLDDYVQPTSNMKLRFDAHETIRNPGEPLVELLVDNVEVYRRVDECFDFTPPDTAAPNAVGNTLAVNRDDRDVLLSWTAPADDDEHDPARYFPVYRSREPSTGFERAGEPCTPEWRDLDMADPAWGTRFYLVTARNAAGESGTTP